MINSNFLKNTKISTQIDHPGASDLAAYGDKLLVPDYNGYVTLYNNKSKKLDKWKTAKTVGSSTRQAQWLNESKFIAITSDDLICKFDVESPIKIGTATNEYKVVFQKCHDNGQHGIKLRVLTLKSLDQSADFDSFPWGHFFVDLLLFYKHFGHIQNKQ